MGPAGSETQRTNRLDSYSGYKARFQQGITEIGCAAHARRKFFDLHADHSSQIAGQALLYFARLYEIERDAAVLDAEARRRRRQSLASPACDAFYEWSSSSPATDCSDTFGT